MTTTIWTEIDRFMQSKGSVFETLQNLARNLTREGIDYTIIGGMALVMHGYVRTTQDVDLLMSAEGLKTFQQLLVGRGFVPTFPGATRRFRDASTDVVVEILIAGEYPGDGKPKPVCFPNPATAFIERDGIRVIPLSQLIELKLASGLTASDRLKDLADVQELIRTLNLTADFATQIDPSVREGYINLWSGVDRAKQEREFES
jgi:hypothetical protein